MATESPKVEFVFPQYLKRRDEDVEVRIVPQSLMEMLEKPKDEQLKYLVAQGLLDAVGYDYQENVRKITRDEKGRTLKDEETVKKGRQPANQQLLTFFIVNISKQLGDNNWQQKIIPTADNRQVTINIDGHLESDRISAFAQRFLQSNTEGNTGQSGVAAKSS